MKSPIVILNANLNKEYNLFVIRNRYGLQILILHWIHEYLRF